MGLRDLYRFWKLYRWYKGGGVSRMDWTRLKSRKLWMTIIGTACVTLAAAMGVEESIVKIIGSIWVTYLGGQAAVDLMAKRNGQ